MKQLFILGLLLIVAIAASCDVTSPNDYETLITSKSFDTVAKVSKGFEDTVTTKEVKEVPVPSGIDWRDCIGTWVFDEDTIQVKAHPQYNRDPIILVYRKYTYFYDGVEYIKILSSQPVYRGRGEYQFVWFDTSLGSSGAILETIECVRLEGNILEITGKEYLR